MSTKHILIGAAAGTALVGIGFLAFHPRGKKICKKLTDIGMELAENALDILRTNMPTATEVKDAASATAKS